MVVTFKHTLLLLSPYHPEGHPLTSTPSQMGVYGSGRKQAPLSHTGVTSPRDHKGLWVSRKRWLPYARAQLPLETLPHHFIIWRFIEGFVLWLFWVKL